MLNSNIMQYLQERNLIAQITDRKALTDRLATGSIVLYCGFDPTADSLHLGHLVPLLCLRRFQLAGHRPIALVGGATGLIGDPSFKVIERKFNTMETVNIWMENIISQISLFLNFNCGDNSAIIVNNYDWFKSMDILTFLRKVGKHFSVSQMINKEAVKQRTHRNNSGISFTEFSYNLLQSYDFAYLNKMYGVTLQIGGSDQWGNITSGIDLTRRMYQNAVYGLTVPLIIKSSGTKFGKTASNTIWIDASKTSPYMFYQFWINTADSDVYRFLKFFTFMDIKVINTLEETNDYTSSDKVLRAQYVLAEEVTRIVHGEQGLTSAKRITNSLFTGKLLDLTKSDLAQLAQDGIPTLVLDNGADLQQALVKAELAPSRSQARTMITSNAVTINGKKQTSMWYVFSNIDRLYGQYTLLCRGKKQYCLINWK